MMKILAQLPAKLMILLIRIYQWQKLQIHTNLLQLWN